MHKHNFAKEILRIWPTLAPRAGQAALRCAFAMSTVNRGTWQVSEEDLIRGLFLALRGRLSGGDLIYQDEIDAHLLEKLKF